MSKHRPPHYRPGSHLKTCDLSGRVDYAENFVKQWNGLIVHKDYCEPRNPQDFTEAVRDSQSVPNPRKDILTVTTGTPSMVQVNAYTDQSGLFVYLVFNRDIDTASSGLTLTADGSPVTINTYADLGGGVLLLGVDQIEAGQTVLLSYAPGNISPDVGSDLAAFSDFHVENNSAYTVTANAYPLEDDGTVATLLGGLAMPTNAPDYLQADYTYTEASPAKYAYALPSSATWLTSQAIDPAGAIMACEAEVITGPASDTFERIQLAVLETNGALVQAISFGPMNQDGLTPLWSAEGGDIADEVRTIATDGCRFGVEVDGTAGTIKYVCGDGTYTSSLTFTPGNKLTFALGVRDSTTTPLGETVSLKLVPAAADMTLTYTAGAVDVFGDTI